MKRWRLLLIEDNDVDSEEVERNLNGTAGLVVAQTLSQGLQELSENAADFDCILLDLALPDSQGLETLTRTLAHANDVPVIVLTGVDDEELGSDAVKLGAQDYLPKSRLESYLLQRSIRYSIERHLAVREVLHTASRWHAVLQSVPEVVVILRNDGTISWLNRCLDDRAPEALIGAPVEDLVDAPGLGEQVAPFLAGNGAGSWDLDTENTCYNCRIAPLSSADQTDAVLTIRDVTQEKKLVEALQQEGRMKAIGRLAGGVAHDFNNLLTIVLSMTRLTIDIEPLSDLARDDLEQVVRAAESAAELTRQLLVFSRRGTIQAGVVDMGKGVLELDPMLRRLLTGSNIELVVIVGDEPLPVLMDQSQFEQILLNLAVNARQAMPGGGTLTIETAIVERGGKGRLAISDTGEGMEKDVLNQLFEPFFTTRKEGTGLGLSVVYGIVQAAGGRISVTSAPGEGSMFEVLLPIADEETRPVEATIEATSDAGMTDAFDGVALLVVEDQPLLSGAITRVLTARGFEVTVAPSAEEALQRFQAGEKFRLVLSDVFLPGISGVELASRVRQRHPSWPVLLTSGYIAEHIAQVPITDPLTKFLPKPFKPAQLLASIDELIQLSASDFSE